MTLSLPKCESQHQITDKLGIYLFKGVKCYGDPKNGPWVEIYESGKVRKFEASEIPVGGYSSVSAQLAQIAEPMPLYIGVILSDMVTSAIDNSEITFTPENL